MQEYELGDLRRSGRATRANVLYVLRGAGDWMTRAQVAHALGLKASPMVIQLLEELVNEGALVKGRTYMPNGSVRFSYACPEILSEAN